MQLLAMLTMLIDHVGIVFLPDEVGWRIVGRLAFPLYAWAIVQGYKHTSNIKRYLLRLFIIGSLSQLPYMLALNKDQINVIGTFLCCLLVLLVTDRFKSKWLVAGIVAGGIGILDVLPFEYGSYALLLILTFRYAKLHWIVPVHSLLNVVYVFYLGWAIQVFSVVSTTFIIYLPYLHRFIDTIKVPRWAWRSFYPVHLLVLAIIKFS